MQKYLELVYCTIFCAKVQFVAAVRNLSYPEIFTFIFMPFLIDSFNSEWQ